jgi:hypothetical protein
MGHRYKESMVMRKFVCAFLAAVGSVAFAQAPFTIVKPAEGAKVRETVPITLPKNSVPPGSFIGVTLDGKFLEATVPVLDSSKKHLVYWLNTKRLKVPDGWHTIGVSLFAPGAGRPQIADKSEVKIHVGNHAGINVPANGALIRYKFYPGLRASYSVTIGQDQSTLSEAQNKLGGRAAELPIGTEHSRVLFAVDDVRNGLGLVRSQMLPYAGKDYTVITLEGDEQPTMHMMDEFAPVYRLLKPNGTEVYADIPNYWGFQGTGTGDVEHDLYETIPLPILPTERLQVGDSWQASIALPGGTLMDVIKSGKSIERIPARGTFEAVEWEQGEPCAKLRYELEYGMKDKDSQDLTVAGREFKQNDRFRFQENAWVSFRTGKMVRSDILIEADQKVNTGGGGGGAMGGGNEPQPQPAGGPGGRGRMRVGGGDTNINLQTPMKGGAGRGGQRGSAPAGGQGGSGGGDTFVRVKMYLNIVLEK